MPEYVIFLHRVTDSPDFTREIVEKHCRHLAKLAAGGRFVAGGPFADEKSLVAEDPDGELDLHVGVRLASERQHLPVALVLRSMYRCCIHRR